MEQHKKIKTNHRTGLKNFIKNPLFWSALILLVTAFLFISSIDLGSIIKIDAQTAIVGEGTARYLTRWVTSGPVPTSTPTLVVTPASATKQVTQTQQYTANYDPDGTGPQAPQNVSASATWSSTNTPIATISATGLATAVAVGTTQIGAVYNSLTATPVTLTVTSAPAPTLVITPASATKQVTQTQQYTATYDPDGTGPQAPQNVSASATTTWSSLNTSFATVNSTGLATAVAVGTTQIQAVYNGLTKTANITVTATPAPTLVVTPASATKQVTQNQQYTATYDPDGAGPQTPQNVTASATWSSINTSIATVNSTGLATAVAIGTTQISATYNTLTNSGDIIVQAPTNNPPTVSGLNGTISGGTMASLTSDCKISDGLTLSWAFSDTDGDTQLAFRIQVSKDPNFVITPYDFDSYNVTSTAPTYKITTLPSGTYYWRIMAWDEHGLASSWVKASASQTITANQVIDFSTSPVSATINQNITFIPSFGAGIISQIASQIWAFPQGLPTSWNNPAVNPVVKFSSVGTKTNTLNITATGGQTCAVTKDLVIGGDQQI